MNFSTLQTRVADYLDRTDCGSRIPNWINDTRKHIALQYNFDYLYAEATMTTSAGSGVYSLPTDYMGHLTVWCQSFKLAKVGAREFDELTGIDDEPPSYAPTLFTETDQTSGSPTYYIDRGMDIQFWPTPDAEYTVTMKYYAQPTDFTLTTDEDYVSRFHFEAIIFGACLRGAVFLDDEVKKVTFKEAYQLALTEMIKREKEKYAMDSHVRMKSWMDYDLNSFKRLFKIDNSD